MHRTLLYSLFLFFPACTQPELNQPHGDPYQPKAWVEVPHPAWAKNATIYELNIRQFTPEGTFKAFASHLPRLKNLGVDIIWFMPIHPIGVKNRKGTLGSEYAVRDYYAINPEFGSMGEFKELVQKIHDLNMHIIIDWVGNHTAWDNSLTLEHPEWYTKTRDGQFQPTPWYDWDDIIDLDYQQPALRKYMTEAMKFWIKETDIDGYRCDTGGFIPTDFWDHARAELNAIKPVFMLAEWESRDLHQHAFDATYAWSLWEKMQEATLEKKGAGPIIGYLAHDVNTHPRDAYRMTFTDNHDKNSWEGNQFTHFGPAIQTAMVLTGVVNGMMMVYGGQEAGLDKSLAFFEKDEIPWKDHPHNALIKKLFDLKHRNEALWNGIHGGEMIRVKNNRETAIISFYREKNGHKVLPILNFTDKTTAVEIDATPFPGDYREIFSGETFRLQGKLTLTLPPWGYKVLEGNVSPKE